MLRFDSRRVGLSAPRNYLAKNQQYRLLALVGVSGLVLILIGRVGREESWAWMFGGQPLTAREPAVKSVDTRLGERLLAVDTPDVFVARAAPAAPPEAGDKAFLRGVRRNYLEGIRDDTVLGGAENDAWFNVLESLQAASDDDLRKVSVGEVAFLQLYKQPKEYRGQVVTIRGQAVRAHRVPAKKNSANIDHYYQVWVRPTGSDSPVVVYALQLPASFPMGMNFTAPCRVRGIFFKRWAYAAVDELRTAPLMLAKTIDWTPLQAAAKPEANFLINYAIATAGVAIIAWAAYRLIRRRREPPYELKLAAPEAFDHLTNVPIPVTTHETLARLEVENAAHAHDA